MGVTDAVERNRLVWLSPPAWAGLVRDRPSAPGSDDGALLALWARRDWPLVVRMQCAQDAHAAGPPPIALGLPAPAAWQRRRLALAVAPAAVARAGRFPRLHALADAVGGDALGCAAVAALDAALCEAGATARVHGAWGWQALTGQPYVHPASDLDLHIDVPGWAAVRVAVQRLAAAGLALCIDGELVLAGGQAVAWREVAQLLAGSVSQVLVKRRDGIGLVGLSALRALAEAGTPVAV